MGETPSEEVSDMLGVAIKARRARLLFWGGLDTDLVTLSREDIVDPELTAAVSVTASLDCVVFEDGTAVGPDTTNLFSQVEDQVQSKKDLLQTIHTQYFSGRPPKEILDDTDELAAQPEAAPSNNSLGSYYRYYRKQYAGEIAAIRKYERDEARTIMRALRPLKKKWKYLKKSKSHTEQ